LTTFEKASEKLLKILRPNDWTGLIHLKNGKQIKIERDRNGFYHVFRQNGNTVQRIRGRMDWDGMVETVLEEGNQKEETK
jgi:hypothetical protein